MNDQTKYNELFDRLLDGTLNEQEAAKLRSEIEKDPELAGKFEQHKLAVDGIRFHGRKEMLEKVKEWDKALNGEKTIASHGLKRRQGFYYAAASLVFLLGVAYLFSTTYFRGYQQLAASYYEPYKYMPSVTRGESKGENTLEEIIDYYDRGEYRSVIMKLNEFDDTQKTPLSEFVLASSYQALDRYKNAAPIYEKIANSSSIYATPAKWYLALCYLSMKKPDLAVPLLESLQKGNNAYAAKASELLKELE